MKSIKFLKPFSAIAFTTAIISSYFYSVNSLPAQAVIISNLSNTLAVSPKNGDSFTITQGQQISVQGEVKGFVNFIFTGFEEFDENNSNFYGILIEGKLSHNDKFLNISELDDAGFFAANGVEKNFTIPIDESTSTTVGEGSYITNFSLGKVSILRLKLDTEGNYSIPGEILESQALNTINNEWQVKSVPEPFTIIGTLIGGTAAFYMRKKLTEIAS